MCGQGANHARRFYPCFTRQRCRWPRLWTSSRRIQPTRNCVCSPGRGRRRRHITGRECRRSPFFLPGYEVSGGISTSRVLAINAGCGGGDQVFFDPTPHSSGAATALGSASPYDRSHGSARTSVSIRVGWLTRPTATQRCSTCRSTELSVSLRSPTGCWCGTSPSPTRATRTSMSTCGHLSHYCADRDLLGATMTTPGKPIAWKATGTAMASTNGCFSPTMFARSIRAIFTRLRYVFRSRGYATCSDTDNA